MEKEEIKSIALFGDNILLVAVSLLTFVEYIRYSFYTSAGIYMVTFWLLYLITTLSVVATIITVYDKKIGYIMPAVAISSAFLFFTSLVISFITASISNEPIIMWVFPLLMLLYITFRAYAYTR